MTQYRDRAFNDKARINLDSNLLPILGYQSESILTFEPGTALGLALEAELRIRLRVKQQ
jgi:hypothetical protein